MFLSLSLLLLLLLLFVLIMMMEVVVVILVLLSIAELQCFINVCTEFRGPSQYQPDISLWNHFKEVEDKS